jgi:hypothetical protein
VKAGGFQTGTPADIIEQLEAVEKRYPGLGSGGVQHGFGLGLNPTGHQRAFR